VGGREAADGHAQGGSPTTPTDGNDNETYMISTTGGSRRQVTDNDFNDYDVDWGVAP